MIRKIFKVGHSYCITIPKKMLDEAGLTYSDWSWVEMDKKGRQIIIRKRRENEW
jgi:antitoxin component of MazEF toxin-antitoxin module